MANEIDIGPLSWVKEEIDLALALAINELEKYATTAESASAQRAYVNVHQVHGALAIVGLDGITELSLVIEEALLAVAEEKIANTESTLQVIQEGVSALRQYLDDLMEGAAHQSLKLFPHYRAVLMVQGLPEPESYALFFPDLTQRPPRRERDPVPLQGEALLSRLRAARLGFERGLLKWIKGDAKGVSEMKASLTMIELTQTTPASRAIWWVSLGVLDALGAEGLSDAAEVKRFLLRLASHIKKHVDGFIDVPTMLLREALYLAAIATQGHAALAVVRAAYRLESLIPAVPVTAGRQGQHMRQLQQLVTAAQQHWLALCEGTIAALVPFHENVTWLANEAVATHEFSYVQLTKAIREQADLLRRNPMRHSEALGTEMASALQLAASALDHFDLLGSAFAQQVEDTIARLIMAASGGVPLATDAPSSDAILQRPPGRALLASVADDIQRHLGMVEQVLDRFFRAPGQKEVLADVHPPLRLVHDALTALGEARAIVVLDECTAAVMQFAEPDFVPQRADFDQVAQKLLSIGFFVSQLAVGPANPDHFFGTDRDQDEMPSDPFLSAAPVDLSAEAADALDADLRAIFLEEAQDILASLLTCAPKLHVTPEDGESLVIVRRGFHTLKGSGRMVGLHDLGEIAWVVEQVLNHWLEHKLAATPALLSMLDDAVHLLQQWIDHAGGNALDQHVVEALLQQCMALGGVLAAPTFMAAGGRTDTPHDVAVTVENPDVAAVNMPPVEPLADLGEQPVSAEVSAEETAVYVASESAEVLAFPEPAPIRVGEVDFSPALYNMYLEEARGYVATLQAQLGQETVPQPLVIRAVHTLASISAATGFSAIHHLAHALESVLIRFEQMAAVPSETQRFVFARCAGALEGMLGAVAARRMPNEENALAATLTAMTPTLFAELAKAADQLPSHADSGGASLPDDEDIEHNDDAVDSHVLSIFMDESADLLRDIGKLLRAWRASPNDVSVTEALARSLHTFKGSARMVGAIECSDVLHAMETRLEDARASQYSGQPGSTQISPALITEMESTLDKAANLVDQLRYSDNKLMPARVSQSNETTESIQQPFSDEPSLLSENASNHQVIVRVRADLIDQWVNDAGEMSISRTRIESELREIKGVLTDLTDSVARLRSQLREVEIQAETQLQSQEALAVDRAAQFDPLEFDRFTRFQEVTRMMAESVNDVATVQHNLLLNLDHANAALMAQARLNRDLSQHLMRARMMPFESLTERLYRVVRQAAKDADRQVVLHVHNGEIEMDRSTLEKMAGPIEHLLRNSIAHGIEDAAQRLAIGKPETGQLDLSLKQEANDIVISLADDGAGLDYSRIRQQAVEQGLLSPEAAAMADEEKLSALIFHPGFSTANAVTSLSGRGVGLGVVKNETMALGGRIEVHSKPQAGTTFLLSMPQTMAIAQVVLVRVGDRHYAIPSAMVAQVNELKPDEIIRIRAAKVMTWQGADYPWQYLPSLLGEHHAIPAAAPRTWVLNIDSGSGRLALEIDALAGNQEIVIKPIGPQLARVSWILGATVLADGEIVFMINPSALAASVAERPVDAAERVQKPAPPAAAPIMVVDDSLTVRKVMSRLLERQGYRVVIAKDGVDALEQLRDTAPEGMPALMLIDIEMPRMDGFELARHIRTDNMLAKMPLIAITSRTADKHRQHAREVGINHYLGKPYNEEQLLALVAGYCRQNAIATGVTQA